METRANKKKKGEEDEDEDEEVLQKQMYESEFQKVDYQRSTSEYKVDSARIVR